METDVDRVLVYLTFYIVECLRKLQKEPSLERGTAAMHSLARENFALPGDAGFPKSLNVFCTKPSRSEAEELKKYFTQVRTSNKLEKNKKPTLIIPSSGTRLA